MPYISEKRRKDLKVFDRPRTAGEFNYALTQLVIAYVKSQGLSYSTINDIVGALDGAKDEFKRRVVGPYEDRKIIENGELYQEVLDLLI